MPLLKQETIPEPAPEQGQSGERLAWPQAENECFLLDPLPGHIKAHYPKLALISHPDHLSHLNPEDEDTLIVSCDWLVWQKCLAKNLHCIYYEFGLLGWSDRESENSDLYIRGNDWVYESGKDQTIFHGVSLGRFFCTEITMCLMNIRRLEQSIKTLLDRFSPDEIFFFDFSNDISVLDQGARRDLIKNIAKVRSVRFIDQGGVPFNEEKSLAHHSVDLKEHSRKIEALLFLYARALEVATTLRCRLNKKNRRVMVVCISNIVEPLIRNFSGGGLTPIFLARTVPKKLDLLWRCLINGAMLVVPKNVPLTNADRARLKEITSAIKTNFSAPNSKTRKILRDYIMRQILESGRLLKIAQDVLGAEQLLDKHQPERVVIDGERNPPPRMYIELAKVKNMGADHTWHSSLIPRNQQVDALGGDPRMTPLITRSLTWGPAHEAWLDAVDSRQPRIRIGSPLLDRYTIGKKHQTQSKQNALILQYTPNVMDLKGLNANIFYHFVFTVRLLQKRGFKNIRFKIHPGPGRWKQSYLEEVARNFNLRCEIIKDMPFEDCVTWADIAVGPVQTGAMYETLAARKPYYAMLLPPHSMDVRYYKDFPIYESTEELERALDEPYRHELGQKLLNDVYSANEFPSPSKRFWEVMGTENSEKIQHRQNTKESTL